MNVLIDAIKQEDDICASWVVKHGYYANYISKEQMLLGLNSPYIEFCVVPIDSAIVVCQR